MSLALVLTLALIAAPQAANVPQQEFTPLVEPELALERASGAIAVDGELDEAAWREAAVATGFTEVMPGDQVAPPVRTEALVTYDEAHLYLAFRAYDDPEAVRASLRNRDEAFQDDWVGLILDTYGDASRAYEIFANPYGIQMDLLMTSSNEDPGFDLLFSSAGRLTDFGYQVEMAIPFSSLRFPGAPVQSWRATLLRNHPRDSRRLYSWATASMDDPCLMCQLGTFSGIAVNAAPARLEVMPAVVGAQSGALRDADDPASRFDNGAIRPEASLNLTYHLSSSVTAEATINPDFSQIESDAAQIDVNSTFALSFPERRPFFQEGSDLFQSHLDVVYTRSINDPIGAAKATARMGRTSVAFVSALDQRSPLLLPFEERSHIVEAGQSLSNILRARRSFGANGYVGATVTDRRLLDGGSGTTVSADLQVPFWTAYTFQAHLAASDTREPDDPALSEDFEEELAGHTFGEEGYTAELDGEHFRGYGLYAGVARGSRHWSFDVGYQGMSPTFRAANGFITRNAYHAVEMEQQLSFYPKWDFADQISPGFEVERSLDLDGRRKQASFRPDVFLRLKGQTFVYASYGVGSERFRGVDFTGLRGGVVEVNSNFSDLLGGGFSVSGGREIARGEDVPEVGDELNAGTWLTLKPLSRLVVRPMIRYASLRHEETGEAYYEGYIFRMQVNLQVTRELSARVVTQYDGFDERIDVEPLVSYKLNPFSVFYVGSTHDYGRFERPHGLRQTERQLFFKFQYLFRP